MHVYIYVLSCLTRITIAITPTQERYLILNTHILSQRRRAWRSRWPSSETESCRRTTTITSRHRTRWVYVCICTDLCMCILLCVVQCYTMPYHYYTIAITQTHYLTNTAYLPALPPHTHTRTYTHIYMHLQTHTPLGGDYRCA